MSTDPADVTFAREKAKRSLPVSLLVLFGIVALYLPLPQRFVAALPFLLAIVLAVRLLGFVRDRAGREKVWPLVTLVLTGLLLASLALQAVFYQSVHAYEQCLDLAQTSQARATCEQLRQNSPFGIDFVVR